jgi:hypothetical protein
VHTLKHIVAYTIHTTSDDSRSYKSPKEVSIDEIIDLHALLARKTTSMMMCQGDRRK